MNNGIKMIFAFTLGAAAGVVVAQRYFKTKYETIAQEEIDSVKDVYSKNYGNNEEDRQTDMYKTKIDNLDLKQIADSGQCFRWKNTGENEYTVVAFDRALRIKQDGNEFELDCDEADWNNIWKSYLDMDTDYAGIAKLIADGDDAHLKEAYAYGSGVRILRQDLWEMIVI